MTNDFTYLASEADAGDRLDRFLAARMGVSLRAARRMIGRGAVSVGGSPRGEAYKLRPGQTVEVEPGDSVLAPDAAGLAFAEEGGPRLLKATGGFTAFFKPSGLHTASLAGGGEPSLEAMLSSLHPEGGIVLVNRLDRDTSGIVLGAASAPDAFRFRELEDKGLVDKRYLAMVRGTLQAPEILRWALDTADRATTRVLEAPAPDSLRWTSVRPLGPVEGGTLVEARISKGARHQIRAHLSRLGHPIIGDSRYGTPSEQSLRLHHWRCSFPGFCAASAPGWNKSKVMVEVLMEEYPCEE